MSDPSAPPISPHEESPPPPPYSEVGLVCPTVEGHNNATQTQTSDGHKTAVIYSVLAVALVLVVVMGCIVGHMKSKLDSLHVTVEEINTREVEILKLEMQSLAGDVDNITSYNEVMRARLEQLSDKVDRLQAQKEGQPYYLLAAKVRSVQYFLPFYSHPRIKESSLPPHHIHWSIFSC